MVSNSAEIEYDTKPKIICIFSTQKICIFSPTEDMHILGDKYAYLRGQICISILRGFSIRFY